MGRRSLRKPDPSLDLSQYLKTVDELPQPWNLAAVFTTEAPLEIEVGSGKGLFLQSVATATPEHNFVGIELARKYAHHAAARLAKREIKNAVVVHGDAQRLFRELVPNDRLTAVHIYFPDPWWKKRHRKRRVMNSAFVKDVARSLAPNGRLHFWTDVEEYFVAGIALVTEHTSLIGPLSVEERPADHDLDFRTHFERRMRLAGEPVFRSEFRKRDDA
jgi:tRNA (guanine-N7-)-methyltransferase